MGLLLRGGRGGKGRERERRGGEGREGDGRGGKGRGGNVQFHHLLLSNLTTEESRAVARKPRDVAAVLFGLKFADDIHHKFKSSHASFEARLQSSKHTGTKQNLTQNGDSKSFKFTCFGASGKA